MSMLFYCDTRNNVVLHPEIVKLCPSFQVLDEKETLFVVLFADYNSIYRQFPEHERRRKAMWHAFNENEEELVTSPHIMTAIVDYISLQYSPKVEEARKYQTKIDTILDSLDAENSPTQIAKMTEAIATLRKRISDLEKEVTDYHINEGVIKGDMKLSYLEKAQSNRKRYLDLISKKK